MKYVWIKWKDITKKNGQNMIKDIDQLKLKLLDMSETERLDRHALVEVSLAEKTDKIAMLEKALKQSQLECAGIRSQLENITKEHPIDMRAE